ncbi:MAG: LysR family transcriptional regulator [Verrucomicrobiales bacterium]|nr:LysR family transcriptional regulator [Verrucomicrobiales bacterium]
MAAIVDPYACALRTASATPVVPMEMHQLRYFLAVVKTGSFSRAAQECHVSQPSLSQQILKLEEELGEALFERRPRGVALTQAGQALAPSARSILLEADEAQRRVREARGDIRGTVTLGVLPTIAPYLLPDLLRQFSEKYPDAGVVVQEDTTARLLMALDATEVDLALLSLPVDAPFVAITRLFEDELLLAVPPEHRLAALPNVTLPDLSGEDFILLREGHCLADQAQDLCRMQADFRPKIACRSAQLETVLALIRGGLGISLIPKIACGTEVAQSLVLRSLAPPASRTIVLVSRKNRLQSLVVRAFSECAARLAAETRVPHAPGRPAPLLRGA